MKAALHNPSDLEQLRQLVRVEANAKQRDRYRVVLLAADGVERTREQIAEAVGRSRQFVDEWVGRYRTGGIGNLRPLKQPGRTPFLTPDQEEELKRAIDDGPQEGADARSVFFGQDIRTLIKRRFNQTYSLSGTYELLKRLGYSWLCPRPRNPRGDPAAQAAFKKKWSTTSNESAPNTPANAS
jgi:transposase